MEIHSDDLDDGAPDPSPPAPLPPAPNPPGEGSASTPDEDRLTSPPLPEGREGVGEGGQGGEGPTRRRFVLLYATPLLLLLAWIALPLARGTDTLYLRDVLNTHMPMKWSQAEAMRAGYFPLIDPYRAGGQPLAGNPNAVPFYPTNLLYLVGSTLWALNAHFWIHLLLAPLAFFWMARSWGLAREPAWAAAVCYTAGGFYLSHMSFYNLIPAATLAPAFVAAALDFAAGRRRRLMAPLLAVLWALILLGGEPLMMVLSGLLAGSAALALALRRPWGSGWRAPLVFVAALGLGTLIALPQIVEFLRILPLSFRGHWGYTRELATVASFDPRQLIEWLIPFAYGKPDRLELGSFWGSRFYTDTPPYYLSLYPGLLVFALIAAAGRPRSRAAWWAWAAIAFGVFVSLGRFNPLVAWVFGGVFGGKGSFRYPVKFWFPAAVGMALLAGIGFARLWIERDAGEGGARRRFRWTLTGLALILGGLWVFLSFYTDPARSWLRGLMPKEANAAAVDFERVRWAGLCLLSLVLLAALAGFARLAARRPFAGGALLLAVHALAHVLLLRPLYPTDAVVPYLVPPPALAYVPADLPVLNPDFNYLFGPSTLKQGEFPTNASHWTERRAFYELYPFTGPIWKRRYELNVSAEGLDTFLTRMAQGVMKGADNEKRFRLLAAWGVGRVVMNHPVEPLPLRARLLAKVPSFGRTLWIYEVLDRAPEVFLARRVFPAPHLNAGFALLADPAFDARSDVVLPGNEGPPIPRGGGVAQVLRQGPESLEVEAVAGPGGSVLVVQRADLLYEAEVDGRPAKVLTANFHRLGVEVPAGRHRVRLWIDRRPLVRSVLIAGLALAFLPVLAWYGRGPADRPPEE